MRFAQFVAGATVVLLIVTVGFGAAVFVLIVTAAVYVLGALAAPAIIRSRLRLTARPVIQPVAQDDSAIPKTGRAHLNDHRAALAALGFEARGVMHIAPGSAPGAYLALYEQSATTARALSRIMLKPGKGPPAVHSTALEFEIRYDNGTSVELSNVAGPVPGLELVPGLIRRMPDVSDVPRLFEYFRKLVAQYESETDPVARTRVALADDATVTTVYQEQLEKSYGIQERAGLLEPTDAADVWRPTWRLAIMIAAHSISPGAEFFTRRGRVRAERLQRELDGAASPTDAGRIGTRTGWLMLVGGLVLMLAASVMSPTGSALAAMGMSIAWGLAKGRGREPGWRALVSGGGAAMVLLGVPIGLSHEYPLGSSEPGTSGLLVLLGLFLLPMGLLLTAAVLTLVGFRAAAA